jgi:hypothetical protein
LTIYPSGKGIVSANDVVIWCNLYPIWQENPDVINSLSSLKKWMEFLHSKESFKKGLGAIVKNVPGKALIYLYSTNTYNLSYWYLPKAKAPIRYVSMFDFPKVCG